MGNHTVSGKPSDGIVGDKKFTRRHPDRRSNIETKIAAGAILVAIALSMVAIFLVDIIA